MYDGRLVQVCQLCHVVGLVEFGGIDLVHGICVNLLLRAVVTLYQQPSLRQVVNNPAPNESRGRIPEPDIALAREVVLSLDDSAQSWGLVAVLGYKLRSERSYGRTIAM